MPLPSLFNTHERPKLAVPPSLFLATSQLNCALLPAPAYCPCFIRGVFEESELLSTHHGHTQIIRRR
jgi:hypothetical protein